MMDTPSVCSRFDGDAVFTLSSVDTFSHNATTLCANTTTL